MNTRLDAAKAKESGLNLRKGLLQRALLPARLPEAIELVEFTIVVRQLADPAAADVAKDFRETVAEDFRARMPQIAELYNVEVIETNVWAGSRKSRNKFRLTKKKGGIKKTLWRWLFVATSGLQLLSTDIPQARENAVWLITHVEQTFQAQGYDVLVEDVDAPESGSTNLFPEDSPPSPLL